MRNSISKDVLIGTSQLKPFEVLMVTSTLRETKDGALASKERQEGAARFHYDVLEKWQERQNEKNLVARSNGAAARRRNPRRVA